MKLTEALELLKDPKLLTWKAWELDGRANDGPRDYLAIEWLSDAERRLGLHDRANTRLRVQWVNYLHDLMGAQPGCPVNKVGTPVVSDIDKLLAPVEIRCAAFVMAAEWKAKQDGKGVAV